MGKRTMVFGKFLPRCGMPGKIHGLSQKIQGTYFEISALYFKIHGLFFSAFQIPDRQQLIKFLKNGDKILIDSMLHKNIGFSVLARGMQGGMCQMCHDEILAKRHCFVSLCCRFCTQVVYFCLTLHLFAYKNVSFRQLASNLKIIGRTLMNQILLRYEPRKIYN